MACELTLIIPCYNEEATLAQVVDTVAEALRNHADYELIIVDDGSQDDSPAIAGSLAEKHDNIHAIIQPSNRGKGAAIHAGIAASKGAYIAIQDADMEYEPKDLLMLYQHAVSEGCDVVYGSRFLAPKEEYSGYKANIVANKCLTWLSRCITRLPVTDMETCYKLIRADVLRSLPLKEKRFGFEPEVTGHLGRLYRKGTLKLAELPIAYHPRTVEEGKKIGLKDGLRALYCIWKYR